MSFATRYVAPIGYVDLDTYGQVVRARLIELVNKFSFFQFQLARQHPPL